MILYGGDVSGKRAVVQGFGNVGASAAYYLAQMGAKVVGIMDSSGGVINEKGFNLMISKNFSFKRMATSSLLKR